MPAGGAHSNPVVRLSVSVSKRLIVQGRLPLGTEREDAISFHVAVLDGRGPRVLPHLQRYIARRRATLHMLDEVGPVMHIRIELTEGSARGTPVAFLNCGCRLALALERVIAEHE